RRSEGRKHLSKKVIYEGRVSSMFVYVTILRHPLHKFTLCNNPPSLFLAAALQVARSRFCYWLSPFCHDQTIISCLAVVLIHLNKVLDLVGPQYGMANEFVLPLYRPVKSS